MKQSIFFKAKPIAQGVTAIMGLAGECAYLVEGKERALLIDTLTGFGNLPAFCRALTALPITVVNTHGHVDHVGGNFNFDTVYIHPADIELMYTHSLDTQLRLDFTQVREEGPVFPSDMVAVKTIRTLPIFDGSLFDLGERVLEVVSVPGHSQGSIILIDSVQRMAFSGDTCTSNTLMCIPSATYIEEYRESLLHLKTHQSKFDVMYGGHNIDTALNTAIDESIGLCEAILEGRDDAVAGEASGFPCRFAKAKGPDHLRMDGGTANINYDENNIFKTQSKHVIN